VKKPLRISISIFLSALILLSGSGLVIGKMICLKSKHQIIFASEAKECCGKESATTSFHSKCCDVTNIAFHQNNFVPANHLSLKSTSTVITTFLPVNITSLSFCAVSEQQFSLYKNPPPGSGPSSSLPLLGVFRI
jgi:hypothetical protein